MKIAHICYFSAGACGVWMRVKQESLEFSRRGHEVQVFSTNFTKESEEIAPPVEFLDKIKINRFPAKRLGGEGFMQWNFKKPLIEFNPDIIIAHNYRHPHTHKAIKIGKKINSPVFLVTHAPFVEGNITRTKFQTLIVNLYDLLLGKKILNKFTKVLAISKWEIPHLLKIGARKEKIKYIPNGIPEEFFKKKKTVETENKILFLGRISPKKRLETLIESLKYIKDKKIKLEIVGPKEETYFKKLENLILKLKLGDRVFFSEPIYDLNKKIDKIDSAKIYVLASRVEGMPQGMIEAMARRTIVIGSNSEAIRDLISDGKNGYLFEFDNSRDLAEKIDIVLETKDTSINKNAKKFVEDFNWNKIYKKLNEIFLNSLK